jgi:hypothetical protein
LGRPGANLRLANQSICKNLRVSLGQVSFAWWPADNLQFTNYVLLYR